MTLTITIENKTDTDFDGNEYTYKLAKATIEDSVLFHSNESTVSDEDVKTNFKTKLTSLGYAWDTEI